jgi:hypothetical protein
MSKQGQKGRCFGVWAVPLCGQAGQASGPDPRNPTEINSLLMPPHKIETKRKAREKKCHKNAGALVVASSLPNSNPELQPPFDPSLPARLRPAPSPAESSPRPLLPGADQPARHTSRRRGSIHCRVGFLTGLQLGGSAGIAGSRWRKRGLFRHNLVLCRVRPDLGFP